MYLVFEESYPLDPTRCIIGGAYGGTDVLIVPVLDNYIRFLSTTV